MLGHGCGLARRPGAVGGAGAAPHRPPRGAITALARPADDAAGDRLRLPPEPPGTVFNPPLLHDSGSGATTVPITRARPPLTRKGRSEGSVSRARTMARVLVRMLSHHHRSDITVARIIFARRGKYPHIDRARLNLMQLLHCPSPRRCIFNGHATKLSLRAYSRS